VITELLTREYWVQRITFAAETNAEDTDTQRDSMTLCGGEGIEHVQAEVE